MTTIPGYRDILKEIGRQLNSRKKLFFRRTVFVVWPFLLIIGLTVVSYLSFARIQNITLSDSSLGLIIFSVAVFIVLSVIWVTVTAILFTIEQYIWTTSYFEGVNLTPDQSWNISKNLFTPTLRLDALIFIRFLLPAFLLLAILAWLLVLATNFYRLDPAYSYVIGGLSLFSVLIIYGYIMTIKLRYVFIFFLKQYGTDGYSPKKVLTVSREFNTLAKNRDLKSILKAQFSVDTMSGVISLASNILLTPLSYLGSTGKVVRRGMETAISIMQSPVAQYANTVGKYMVFRATWQDIYGTNPEISKYIYQLDQK